MPKEVAIEEMKKCLEEADMYEVGMDDELIMSYYNAIRNSEASLQEESHRSINIDDDEASKSLNESANELLKAIQTSEVVAPSKRIVVDEDPYEGFVKNSPANRVVQEENDESWEGFVRDISKSRVVQVETETTQEKNNNHKAHQGNKSQESDTILDIKKTPIGFDDMPKSQKFDKQYLKVMYHDLKFVSIQNSNKFLSSNSENRIKMLLYYHKAMAKLKSHYASLSTIMAPIGKPITAIDAHLCINPVISSLNEEEDFPSSTQDVYVSRSGRMTKKRVYNDNVEFDEILLESASTKKIKNDDEVSKKAAKTNLRKNSLDEPPVNSNNNSKIKKFDLATTSSEELFSELDSFDNPPAVLKPSTTRRKMPSNEEIMERSTLFKDTNNTPKRGGGRTNAILNAAKEQTERNKQQEDIMEKFTNSLDTETQAFDDDTDKVIFVDQVEARRIAPVAPRRSIHGRKRGGGAGVEPLNITTKRAKTIEEIKPAAVNGVGKKNIRRVTIKNTTNEPSPSTSRAKKEANTICPICRVSFPTKDIEEHAATCGLDVFPSSPQHQRLTCEICDTVIPFSTQYEIHVKECLAKKNG